MTDNIEAILKASKKINKIKSCLLDTLKSVAKPINS